MTSRELWELDDADIWAQVDYAWIMETFARNEISEARERRQAIARATAPDLLVFSLALERYAEAMGRFLEQVRSFTACWSATIFITPLPVPARQRPKRDRSATRPRQCPPLTAALQANARPLQQAHLPRQTIRRVQHR